MIDPKVFKQVRKALGLSQQDLANALGLSRVTVNKMERGRLRRGIPDEVATKLLALKPASGMFEMVQKHHGPIKPYGADPTVERTVTGPHVTRGKSTWFVWEKALPNGIPQTVSSHATREEAEDAAANVNDAHLWDNEEDES